jgi:hypothetical protein
MAEHVDEIMCLQTRGHLREIGGIGLLLCMRLIVGRIVEILPVQHMNRADDEVEGRTRDERAARRACLRRHADLDAEAQALAAQRRIRLPVGGGIERKVILARKIHVEMLREYKSYAERL